MDILLNNPSKAKAVMKITPGSYFKAGSYTLVVVSISHLIGQFWLTRPANNTERELMHLMTSYEKKIAGGSLSMMEVQDGLSLSYALFFLFAGCMNLFLAQAIHDNSVLKPISLINALTFFVGAVISILYFFWLPVVSFTLPMVCFTLAGMNMRSA
jgi:hypothetical protein